MRNLRQYIRSVLSDDPYIRFQALFQAIRDSRLYGEPEPFIDYNKLAVDISDHYEYETPLMSFVPTTYDTFEDYFLRKLSQNQVEDCQRNCAESIVCAPAEATVDSFTNDDKKIILKNSVVKFADLLLPEGYTPIHFRLRICDYHWVHSPVDGIVSSVEYYDHNEISEGSDSLCLIKIRSQHGEFGVICVGECTVQTFVSKLRPGTRVNKMDVLGYFYFGSRVVLLLPPKMVHHSAEGQKYFPGDPVIVPGR